MNKYFCIIFLAVLTACTTLSAPSPNYKENELSGNGMVLFSTSAEKTSQSFAVGFVLYRLSPSSIKNQMPNEAFFLNNAFQESHFPSEHVNVHWRVLEPGEYMLKGDQANPYFKLISPPEYHFVVEAGKNIYLGNFHLVNERVTVRDLYPRDFSYFNTHTAGVKPSNFIHSIASNKVQ